MEQRKLLLSMMVVGMLSSAALALAPMGPPVATLAEGQAAVGLGYAMSDMTVELSGPTFGLGDAELDVENTMYYGVIGYGISSEWNAYVALGFADAEIDADSGDDFEGGADFGFAVGTKRTLHDNGTDTKWGTVFQYSTGETDDKISVVSQYANFHLTAVPGTIEYDWYEIQLALGPAVQVNEDLCLYGGPFLHFAEGDLRHKAGGVTAEFELEQAWELGGYIGALLNLGGSASLSAEFLITGEAWGAGIGVMFPL
jgi:opacity protein-like surface antigen